MYSTYDVCAMEGRYSAHILRRILFNERTCECEKGLRGLSLRFRTPMETESARVYPYSRHLCTPVCTVARIGTP
jgi:hypothetical protein